jgi:predicted methyltransferase
MGHSLSRAGGAALAVLAAFACAASAAPKLDLAAIVADPARPEADRARDADRKPAELVAFARVHPGEKIAELAPGGGYFTRILSAAVGPTGHVYAIAGHPSPELQALAQARPNVSVLVAAPGTIPTPEPVDLVWTTLNYHDFHNQKVGNTDGANAIDAAAFNALKRRSTYLIVDHEAGKGVGASATSTLHRIDSALVRQEVEKAGFTFDARSDMLSHPADDHSKPVVDPAIRGKTDQFVFRFWKP